MTRRFPFASLLLVLFVVCLTGVGAAFCLPIGEEDDLELLSGITDELSTSLSARLVPTDAREGDAFGSAVAVSGTTAAVGAPGAPAVYLFDRAYGGPNTWGQRRRLSIPGGEFGFSVALSGDTLAVGDEPFLGKGAVYLFERNRGGTWHWGQTAKLVSPDPSVFSNSFGYHVALDGNLLVVGAPIEDRVYIYERNQGGTGRWNLIKKIIGPTDSFFGTSVSVSVSTVLVGADGGIGAAYIFGRNQGAPNSWALVKKLAPPFGAQGDRFGSSVSLSVNTAVVGSFNHGGSAFQSGEAYVFERARGGRNKWGLAKILVSPDSGRARKFGYSVSISGDVILVGSRPFFQDGSACFFERNRGGNNLWGSAGLWKNSDGTFGGAVAVSPAAAVIGQDEEDTGPGSAFAFRITP